jgi:hypothetical protein
MTLSNLPHRHEGSPNDPKEILRLADIHGILMRAASLEDTLHGKIKAWRDAERRQSKKLKDLGDIARLVESHPDLWDVLDADSEEIIKKQ